MNDYEDYITNGSFELINIESANINVFGLVLEKIEAFEDDTLDSFEQETTLNNAQDKTALNPSGKP